jgi:ATP-dependent DNA ligase
LNEHYEGGGEIVFEHARKLGCEGIVSKRFISSALVRATAKARAGNATRSADRSGLAG